LSCDFVVHAVHWHRCPLAAADPHARAWLTLQSHRGLARNMLDAYARALGRYLAFLVQRHLTCMSTSRVDIAFYLSSGQAGERLSNATVQ
jgi:site-specific recombinase XerD